jgi:hypothetical protein
LRVDLNFWSGLLRKEIQDIAQSRALGAVNFSIGATITGHCGKSLVLYIEYLSKHPASRTELVGIEAGIFTFNALPIFVLHGANSPMIAVSFQNLGSKSSARVD